MIIIMAICFNRNFGERVPTTTTADPPCPAKSNQKTDRFVTRPDLTNRLRDLGRIGTRQNPVKLPSIYNLSYRLTGV